ncbi:hypothetical protein [Hyphococcus luteus]|uniref:Shikimate kinase n=1 Tax=Hyphococcus luteus TaxID=2058213 RepID=A0A2S7K4R4_9PROT|nr:hypothetical protein [Marinicaulis flavus]PQA87471.1 hypothetical protein CW354_11750 [Marinicaulis flavus]
MIIKTGALFQAFKYLVYALLAINTGHFFLENFAGSSVTYDGGVGLRDVIVAYTDSIDTAAWLVLLLLLELETFVLPDHIKAWAEWTMNIVTVVCFAIILYALYGYVATLWIPLGFEPYAGADPCTLIGGDVSFALSLDEYVPLTAENCALLRDGAFFHPEANLFATPENLSNISRLAWTDVLNASVWVVIVAVLELEVYLQSSKLFGTKFFFAYKSAKLLLYGALFVCAFYWWMLGEPWDAWDAFLWLVAFFFIEMNMLSWQEENAEKREAGKLL